MPVPPKPIPPELLAEARRLYEQTRVPVSDICALLGIGERTFHTRVRKWKWRRRIERVPADEPAEAIPAVPAASAVPTVPVLSAFIEAAAPATITPFRATLDDLATVVVRVMRAVERQMAAVERIAATLNPTPEHAEEAERCGRALASLSRTLTELKTIIVAIRNHSKKPTDDNAVPRNLDELRRELSARLERFVAEDAGEIPGEPEDRGGD